MAAQTSSEFHNIADSAGLAVVITDANRIVAAANDNSICRSLNPPDEFIGKCAEDCGRAFERTREAGGFVDYECHAGLKCRAIMVRTGRSPLVAITGRTFVRSEDYRTATNRAISGDWNTIPPERLFDNVIFSSSPAQIDKLQQRLAELNKEFFAEVVADAANSPALTEVVLEVPPVEEKPAAPDPFESSLLNYNIGTPAAEPGKPDPFESSMLNVTLESPPTIHGSDIADREAWRMFIPSLLKVSYKLACQRILEFLARHYGIETSLWLQREGGEFEPAAASGEFGARPVRIGITPDDKRIRAAVRDDSPLVLKERVASASVKPRLVQLFPVVIGGEVRNALGVAREEMDPELSSRVLKFCRYVASRLEILRLREAVAERERVGRILKQFNERLRNVDTDNYWQRLIDTSAELVGAERASLLIRDQDEKLTAKAVIGSRIDLATEPDLGGRVARSVLENARPIMVIDAARASLPPTPADRNYRSSSFISYPIILGDRAIGVLNFTDKAGDDHFDIRDAAALDSIAPQIAVAIDRMALREKAGEYQQLSITDPLTGLLNRRYIEERLAEETNRSQRSGEPLTLLMLDVDEFKTYNDRFGHPAGDEALRIVGRILKENLRGADVAARYGGEEFSVLLPATSGEEAEAIAERIRRQAEDTKFPKRRVTLSIGVASLSPEIDTVAKLFSAADTALYQAKQNGRNAVHTYRGLALDPGEQVH